MKLTTILSCTIFSAGLWAQSAAPPSNFVGVGAAYNPAGSPKTTGWASWGKLIDPKSESYFFTTEDAIIVKVPTYTVQTSIRVGVASLLKQFGTVKVYGIVDGGGATTGTSTGGAASGGGIAQMQIGKTGYHFMAGFRILKTSSAPGTPKMFEFGFLRSF